MTEEVKMSEVMDEIKGASEDELKQVIEQWFESTRTQGMKIGARYISAAIYGVIQKHIRKQNGAKASLREYQRCVDDIMKIVTVQLTQQEDTEETMEETTNDGATE